MVAVSQPNQDMARQVVRNYLTAAGRSVSSLAEEARLNRSIVSKWLANQADLSAGSALKLYMAIERGLTYQDRQAFVQGSGLPETLLATPLAPGITGPSLSPTSLGMEGAGHYWMTVGYQVAQDSWQQAIPLFRAAECIFGPLSSAAAMASCVVGQVYMNLGDYALAQREFLRLQLDYERVMDPKTEASIYETRGMLCYYLGDYLQAEGWFQRCLRLAEDWRMEILAWNACHFLGRVYTAWGVQLALRHDSQADDLFHRAESYLAAAHRAHVRLGNDTGVAYDVLRRAQLARAERRYSEVGKAFKKARQGFVGDEIATCHVELQEAELAQEDGETEAASGKAEHALETFTEIAYANGMADSLRILGVSEQMRGRLDRALPWYAASLCVSPSAGHPANRALWADLAALRDQLIIERGREGYRKLAQHVRDMVEERRGEFGCLSHLAADRSADIARILHLLEPGMAESNPANR